MIEMDPELLDACSIFMPLPHHELCVLFCFVLFCLVLLVRRQKIKTLEDPNSPPPPLKNPPEISVEKTYLVLNKCQSLWGRQGFIPDTCQILRVLSPQKRRGHCTHKELAAVFVNQPVCTF